MRLLYNLGIHLYYLLILLASAWNEKAAKWIQGRKKWKQELAGKFTRDDSVIWFHCASLGEFEQGRPIIERVKGMYPDYKILLTFFSPSGYEKRRNFKEADFVTYLPLDTSRNASEFLKLVPVKKVFFIKYEFWYYFLKELNGENIPVFLASGNFRANQLFFKWYGGWYKKFLSYFTHIFVQNNDSEKLLKDAGILHVSVAGDTRFERVEKIARESVPKDYLLNFSAKKPVIIAGSTWEKDEELIHGIYLQLSTDYNWIIAPHEPTGKNIQRLQEQFPDSNLYSMVKDSETISSPVVIVDTIGNLSSLYQYGTIAYIGGGFGKGIHNILEAAAFGIPILFGPNFNSFEEAKELLSAGAAYVIKHTREGVFCINDLVNNDNKLKKIAETTENYIIKRVGATQKIVDFVFIKED